jgi:hypothetical protein
MKVTTELKRLITEAFSLKEKQYREELKETATKEYQTILTELESTEVFQNYKEAAKELADYLDEKYSDVGTYSKSTKPYYRETTRNIVDVKPSDFIGEIISRYVSRQPMRYSQSEQDKLLVKLIYEKDLETIKELLKEYDIEL